MATVDAQAARELELFIENDSGLYQKRKAYLDNMRRKMKAGKYDPAKGVKLWDYYIKAGASEYIRQYGGTMAMFNPATRTFVAKRFEKEARDELKGAR